MTENVWDVIVVGAGASGMLAAYRAASRGLSTVLLEKNRKTGTKILMSGGTRCNITQNTDTRGIIAAYGKQGRFLYSALAALSPDELIAMINEQGVATKAEDTGKIFPISNRAVDVRDALLRLVQQTECSIRSEAPVERITRENEQFILTAATRRYTTRNLVITTGGMSYPESGTTGDGYSWAEQFGHSIVPTVPALAPLVVGDQWPRDLSGLTIEDVELTVVHGTQEKIEQSRGSFLFTHFGFSGPTAMDVSRAFGRYPTSELTLRCDFWPGENVDQLRESTTATLASSPSQPILSLFRPELPKRFVEQILQMADIPPTQNGSEISRKKLSRAVQLLKNVEFKIQGTRGYKKAEVTAGGVSLKEVDSSTMQSKLQPGLYFAGEILDLDGPIGGYNFQAAFSTGWLAGSKVV